MTFKRMKFKDALVYVEVDERGEPVVDKGRAKMKYQLDSDRIYRPNLDNLSEVEGITKKSKAGDVVEEPSSTRESEGIKVFTDGACIGNPGAAGFGYAIYFANGERIARGEPLGQATNNIAELTAILEALRNIEHRTIKVTVWSDSEYAIGVLTRGWKARANRELIKEVKKEMAHFKHIELKKVKGHAGVRENELVDHLARRAAETQAPMSA